MPAAIPIIVQAVATYIGASAVVATALATASSFLVGSYQRRRQERRARDAWNASLQDVQRIIRSGIAAAPIVYGETVVSGPLLFAESYGQFKRFLAMVIAIAPHEIVAIDDVIFNDESIGALDANGYVLGGKYLYTRGDRNGRFTTTVNPDGTWGVVLAETNPIVLTAAIPSTEGATDAISFSVAGNTVSGSGQVAGTQVTLSYTYTETIPLVQVTKYLGAPGQTADAALISQFPGKWSSAHSGQEVAYVIVRLQYDKDYFDSGIPQIKFKVRGKKCFDPRTSTTVYSDNPLICARDYITSALGFNSAPSEVNDALIIAGANICDESVQFATGQFVKRFTCNGAVSTESDRMDNLEAILTSCLGSWSYSNGQWQIRPAHYITPTVTLTAADVGGDFSAPKGTQADDVCNGVKALFVDPSRFYQLLPAPPYVNPTYVAQDGEELIHELTLPFTNSAQQAQRIAKIYLERKRQNQFCQALWDYKAWRIQSMDGVALDVQDYGFAGKAFRVLQDQWSPLGGIELVLQEDAPGVYQWNLGEYTTYDLAPNSTLPLPTIPATISTMTVTSNDNDLLVLGDGTIVSRMRVVVSASQEENVRLGGALQVQYRSYKGVFSLPWVDASPALGTETQVFCAPVEDRVHYDVRARYVNVAGMEGLWQYQVHRVVGKSNPPAAPTALSVVTLADGTRRYSITMPATLPLDIAGARVAFNVGATALPWASQALVRTELITVRSDQGGVVITFDHPGPGVGVNSFRARLVDSSGNESATEAVAQNVTLGLAPNAYKQSQNRLRNSNWSTNATSEAASEILKRWTLEVNGGLNTIFGRGFVPHNAGNLSGCYTADSNQIGAGVFSEVFQEFSSYPGEELEYSVYCAPHRCVGSLVVYFFDAANQVIFASVYDQIDVGSGQRSNDLLPYENRLWAKVVSPAATSKIRFSLRKYATNAGNSFSYCFFDKAYAGRAPVGVTRETATPWQEGYMDAVPGTGDVDTLQLAPNASTSPISTAAGSSLVTLAGYNPGDPDPGEIVVVSSTFTPASAGELKITATADVKRTFYAGGDLLLRLYIDSTLVETKNIQANFDGAGLPFNPTLPVNITARVATAGGAAVNVSLRARGLPPAGPPKPAPGGEFTNRTIRAEVNYR
jgi:hypothetical protein